MLQQRTPLQRKTPLKAKPDGVRRCKVCKAKHANPDRRVEWCSEDCGAALALKRLEKIKAKQEATRKKVERAAVKERKDELKPLHYWAKRAEKQFNRFIRLRDAGEPCISCGTYDAPTWHAGHMYTVAARPDIRFHEDNVHLQCPKCNTYNGGMVGEYKLRVVSKIGQERFDALVYVNPAFKKTREYYQAIEAEYKAKCKELERGHQ